MLKLTTKIESLVPPILNVAEVQGLWKNGSHAWLPETKPFSLEFVLSSIVYCLSEKMNLDRIYLMACLLTLAPFVFSHFEGLTYRLLPLKLVPCHVLVYQWSREPTKQVGL